MQQNDLLQALAQHKERLLGDVLTAYSTRGMSYGRERFSTWRTRFEMLLDDELPGESAKLRAKLHHICMVVRRGESDADQFWRQDGSIVEAYIDSLTLDLENGEYSSPLTPSSGEVTNRRNVVDDFSKVFIVHGHDQALVSEVARFVERLGFEPVILNEQPSGGRTIIEKIEAYSDVGFAIVIYTPDDVAYAKSGEDANKRRDRARQNVVFEHGYLIAKLARQKVVSLVIGDVELPSDIRALITVSGSAWQFEVAKEMKVAGYAVDFNKLAGS